MKKVVFNNSDIVHGVHYAKGCGSMFVHCHWYGRSGEYTFVEDKEPVTCQECLKMMEAKGLTDG